MNRHERRRAEKMARNRLVADYVEHLPEVSVAAPYERGRVHHTVYYHDDCCAAFRTGSWSDCDCHTAVRRFVEPRRS
jgi:hypothetical protein